MTWPTRSRRRANSSYLVVSTRRASGEVIPGLFTVYKDGEVVVHPSYERVYRSNRGSRAVAEVENRVRPVGRVVSRASVRGARAVAYGFKPQVSINPIQMANLAGRFYLMNQYQNPSQTQTVEQLPFAEPDNTWLPLPPTINQADLEPYGVCQWRDPPFSNPGQYSIEDCRISNESILPDTTGRFCGSWSINSRPDKVPADAIVRPGEMLHRMRNLDFYYGGDGAYTQHDWWRNPGVESVPAFKPNGIPSGLPQNSPQQVERSRDKPRTRLQPNTYTEVDASGAIRNPAKAGLRYPPGPNTKETKAQSRTIGLIAAAANGVTELKDAIDALYDALPASVRATSRTSLSNNRKFRYVSFPEKIRMVWEHFGSIDVTKAVAYLAYNYVEDKIIGTLNRKAGEANERLTGKRVIDIGVRFAEFGSTNLAFTENGQSVYYGSKNPQNLPQIEVDF